MKHKCCKLVHDTHGVGHHKCDRAARVERDGNWYCVQHDPVARKERADKRQKAWNDKWNAEHARTKHAAACVAALSGLNPAGVKGMVEAVQRVLDLQFIELTHDENQTQEQFDEALAKDAAEQSKAMADLATALANLKGNA